MNRRDFLKISAQTGLFLGLGQSALMSRALADDGKDANWFFVQIHMDGGWDVTLGVDPWTSQKPDEKEMFIEYDPSNLERVGNIPFGPSMLAMKPFANRMAIINGIFMSTSDNGHDAAQKYMTSGSTDQQWGILPVEILENRESRFFGVLNNFGVYTGSRTPVVTSLGAAQALANNSQTSLGFQSSQNSRDHLSQLQGKVAQSGAQVGEMRKILQAFSAQGSSVGEHQYLAAAFAAGLSQTAFLRLSASLDSHSDHPQTHLSAQKTNWEKLAELLKVFESTQIGTTGLSLLDRTTFFVSSEFSRTAALNSSQGKDHNPLTNSVLLMGPSIKGNRVIGGSHLVTTGESKTGSSYHIASPIDLQSGRPLSRRAQGAGILRPENVAATVIEAVGISRRRFASVDPKIQSLSHLLR